MSNKMTKENVKTENEEFEDEEKTCFRGVGQVFG